MHKHEHKTCPRCQTIFECKVGDISNCQCYAVKLNDAERDFLAEKYQDCLCADCIRTIRTAFNQSQKESQLKKFSENR